MEDTMNIICTYRTGLRLLYYTAGIILILTASSHPVKAQGNWNAWEHNMPIVLTHLNTATAQLLPVDVTFSVPANECPDPQREIRLILTENGKTSEIPFQLSGLSVWTKDTDGEKSRATLNGMITFFDTATTDGDATYAMLYGNPKATAPSYSTDLRVSGESPSWTIENRVIRVGLHGKVKGRDDYTNHDSGQISSVVIKSRPNSPIAPEGGVIHWNPGVFAPLRGWMHAFQWDPPTQCEIESGPLFVEVRRSGIFPGIPEVHLSVNYRIFADRDFVESGTVMEVRDDIGVVALRNNQLVFDSGTFTHIAWNESGETVQHNLADYEPVNRHGDILRLIDDPQFVTFFNPDTKIGAASVKVAYSNTGPGGRPPTLFDNATYVSNGGHGLMYFFRPLIYFHVGWDRTQLITVPKGSQYMERNLYQFYETGQSISIEPVEKLSDAVTAKPRILIGPFDLPPDR